MRGVILAGGYGTRMRPSTLATNKHLCPLYSGNDGAVPMIFYPINTLIRSGITDILVISSREHSGSIIENLGDGWNFGARFTYKVQDVAHVELGIASALKLAEDFTQDDPFAVILGDNFYEDLFKKQFDIFEINHRRGYDPPLASIFVKEVPDPERFGVYTVAGQRHYIEEKPRKPKGNWAVTGLYLYTRHVYEIANRLNISDRGELEITDINNEYFQLGKMSVNYISGFWSDMGMPASMLNTLLFVQENGFKVNYKYDDEKRSTKTTGAEDSQVQEV